MSSPRFNKVGLTPLPPPTAVSLELRQARRMLTSIALVRLFSKNLLAMSPSESWPEAGAPRAPSHPIDLPLPEPSYRRKIWTTLILKVVQLESVSLLTPRYMSLLVKKLSKQRMQSLTSLLHLRPQSIRTMAKCLNTSRNIKKRLKSLLSTEHSWRPRSSCQLEWSKWMSLRELIHSSNSKARNVSFKASYRACRSLWGPRTCDRKRESSKIAYLTSKEASLLSLVRSSIYRSDFIFRSYWAINVDKNRQF